MEILQKFHLSRCLHTFCGNGHTKTLQQLRDVQQQLFTIFVTDLINQTLVQFDGVKMHDI